MALTPLTLALIDPRRILEIGQKYPIISSGLSWCTAREFAALGNQAIRLGRLSAKARIAHFVLELWHRLRLIGDVDGSSLWIPMVQRDIGDTLGLSSVYVSRVLNELREDGLINQRRDKIELINFDSLCSLGQFNAEHHAAFEV